MFRRKRRSKKELAVIIAIAALVLSIVVRARGGDQTESAADVKPAVSLLALEQIADEGGYVLGTGTVESLEQVELRSEVSARVTGVNVALGQTVSKGQVLARFDGAQLSAQRRQALADLENAYAAQASAEAGIDAQQAVLDDLTDGARPEEIAIAQAAMDTAAENLDDSYADTKNVLEGIVNSVENTIYVDIDPMFTNPRTYDPQLTFTSFDQSGRTQVQGQRVKITTMLEEWTLTVDALGSEPVEVNTALLSGEQDLLFAQEFLETLMNVIVNEITLTETEKETYIATVTAARAAVSVHLTTVQSHLQQIDTQKLALAQAEEQLKLTLAGPTTQQIAAQEAAVRQSQSGFASQGAQVARALAAIDSINAQLAKTVIRSPINGTVAVLPVKRGELVSPGALVASVVNTEGLQVKAFIDSAELRGIAVGATSTINESISGSVTHIAPSIDPATRKVEVVVAINDEDAEIVIGEFADISVERSDEATAPVRLPLQAIYVTTDGSFVMSVSDEGKIVTHPVVLDRVVGESVEVIGGLDELSTIVENVRGLDPDEEVTIR